MEKIWLVEEILVEGDTSYDSLHRTLDGALEALKAGPIIGFEMVEHKDGSVEVSRFVKKFRGMWLEHYILTEVEVGE